MLGYRKRRLHLDGIPIEKLARRFGTPLYVYSKACLVGRYRSLRTAFRGRDPLICYALKANPNRALCRILAERGAGAEVVSGGELLRALAAGFAPERIVFSGVGKTAEELELSVRRGVLALHLESWEELEALEGIARRLKRRAPVGVRLNPDIAARTHPHIATGRAGDKFGVERTEALAMLRRAARSRWLRVVAVQCHIGSQILETRPYRLAARALASLILELEGEGVRLAMVDMGGGLGISYRGEPEPELPALARVWAQVFKPWPGLRLLLEPGRYLMADAGVLLTRVLYRKRSFRQHFLIVDAAMNDLARPALYGAYHPVWPARQRGGQAETVDVVGPVCESVDFLARERRLPPCLPGDVLAVLKAGAYGFSMSSQYNSRPRAAEVLVEEGREPRLIRRRETVHDLLRREIP